MAISPKIKKSIIFYKKNVLDKFTKVKPYKKLCVFSKRAYGRNNSGKFTVYKNKGCKKKYRIISFKNRIMDSVGIVTTIEYDPNRNCFISLLHHSDLDKYEYILTSEGLKIGDKVLSSKNLIEPTLSACSYLINFPIGTYVHNVESFNFKRCAYARSAGTFVQIIEKRKNGYVLVKMPSKETRLIHGMSLCSVGIVSNVLFKNRMLYKAGQNIHRGVRPKVRGVAKNPVDHPHGGRARSGTKRPPCNFKGLKCKGFKTVRKKNRLIISKKEK